MSKLFADVVNKLVRDDKSPALGGRFQSYFPICRISRIPSFSSSLKFFLNRLHIGHTK